MFTLVLVIMIVDVSLFSSYHDRGAASLLMEHLFHFSVRDGCNKVINSVVNVDESNVRESGHYHVNFGCCVYQIWV